jgi:hypothetical protein
MAWNPGDAKYAIRSGILHRPGSGTPTAYTEDAWHSAVLLHIDSCQPHLLRIEFPRVSPYDNDADEFVRLNSRERTGGAER